MSLPHASYYESAEGCTISRARAKRMVERFDSDSTWADFVADHGDHPTYDAQVLLGWLGY